MRFTTKQAGRRGSDAESRHNLRSTRSRSSTSKAAANAAMGVWRLSCQDIKSWEPCSESSQSTGLTKQQQEAPPIKMPQVRLEQEMPTSQNAISLLLPKGLAAHGATFCKTTDCKTLKQARENSGSSGCCSRPQSFAMMPILAGSSRCPVTLEHTCGLPSKEGLRLRKVTPPPLVLILAGAGVFQR